MKPSYCLLKNKICIHRYQIYFFNFISLSFCLMLQNKKSLLCSQLCRSITLCFQIICVKINPISFINLQWFLLFVLCALFSAHTKRTKRNYCSQFQLIVFSYHSFCLSLCAYFLQQVHILLFIQMRFFLFSFFPFKSRSSFIFLLFFLCSNIISQSEFFFLHAIFMCRSIILTGSKKIWKYC